ncbi:MAG: YihY/virulence factor BrkB family protein [Solirubrobacteraceae bacterium]|nr:YihY/virulence factor BrkB family protein [Solirubrobacteraceae bacterium]
MTEAPSTAGQPGALKTAFNITVAAGKRLGDGGTDRAAALAYYAIQAIFPGLFVIAVISLLLSSQESISDGIDWAVDQGLDRSLADSISGSLADAAERAQGAAGIAAVIAALTAISGASGWFAAAGRAIEPDPAHRRSRNIVTGKLRASAWTLVMIMLLIAALTVLAVGGTVADEVFSWFGASEGAPVVWRVLRPPLVALGIVGAMLLLYRVAPDRIHPTRMRHLLPGAIASGIGWVIASLGFFFYIGNLASIGTTYGAFATPIVLLLWLYLSGVVVLFGAELNGELARRRAGVHGPAHLPGADDPDIAGHPAGRMPPRDEERRSGEDRRREPAAG